jgi:DNA polymerase-3 subunit alpha
MLLNCHTYYSFCYGTYSIEALLDAVRQNGYYSFALNDINNTSACLETIRLAGEKGVRAVVGIDFRNGVQQQYVGIAMNNKGFHELNDHLSAHLHSATDFDPIAPVFENAFVIYPFSNYKGWTLRENEFLGVSVKDLTVFAFSPYKNQKDKNVILQTASFASNIQFNTHRLLRAIDTNNLLSMLPVNQQAKGTELLYSKQVLSSAFAQYPEIMDNTNRLLDACSIHFEYGKLANKNLKYFTGSANEDRELLRNECMKGLPYRYPNPSAAVLDRIEKELDIIFQLNFCSYFLINWDIVRYAQHKDYFYVGRGSGANSILAYLLRITDVDPIELDLYFERFINIHRSNAPDFDMDFSWTDRDDITRYIFDRFGHERTALLGAYNTFQHDAVIRELGKVFGLPAGEIDQLQRVQSLQDTDELGQLVLRYSKRIHGFPSHLSIHSSGIIISEAPIHAYSATNMPPKGYPTTQFSMLEAEDIGLYKFDILSQRGLGKIKDTVGLVKKNKGVDIDIHRVSDFKKDEKIKALLRQGNTIGCFYVESPAMRMLLAKLQADDYLRLVAASSIIRPGVSKSGMMREYIVRYRNETLRKKARAVLPELYDILEETYGVMVYQEDVIKIAHLFAGLTLAEADYLRRGMSWKFKKRNEFSLVQENFFNNCRKKGYAEKLIEDIWLQIESFANFAFSKGHSASYAVESYQALYLKAHYPLEYMVATLNNGGGFYRTELYIHEARMNGASIIAPCLNRSDIACNIQGDSIYLGFGMIAGLEQQSMEMIIAERAQHGAYKSLEDVVKRMAISLEQMSLLIRAGAMAFTEKNKKELLWEMYAVLRPNASKVKTKELFEIEIKKWKLPVLTDTQMDEAFDQIDLFGFSLCSPFLLLRDPLPEGIKSKSFKAYTNKQISVIAYLVSVKNTSTSKGERMSFGTFVDMEGNWVDTVHFPPSIKQYRFAGSGCYELKGKVVEDQDFITLEVNYMKRLAMVDREKM